LGAKVFDIIVNISKEYLYLIIIALITSIPVLIWGISTWLNNFPTKMTISVWLFIIPVIIVFFITMISVSAHTIKAAWRNPVDTLKYE